jgi:integrase
MAGFIRLRKERWEKDPDNAKRRVANHSWEVCINLDRDPVDGRRRQEWVTVRGSKRDAEAKLAELLHKRNTGADLDPRKVTVRDFLRQWLRDYAEVNVSPSTYERYEEMVEHHLIPALGSIRLRALRPGHIQKAYAEFASAGGRRRKGEALSARTVKHVHAVLRLALRWAVRWQYLANNPSDAAAPPRAARKEMRALNQDEAARLLDAAAGSRFFPVFFLLLQTGVRIGEALALRWQDVELDRGTIQIVRTHRFYGGKGIVAGQPKTPRSRRLIALSPETVRVLAEHRRAQLEERLGLGPAYRDNGLVFADDIGEPLYDSTVRRAFYAIVERAGLERELRIHDLRHTAATLMLANGVHVKVVSERLGHADIAFTLKTYGHVLPGMDEAAAAMMDRILVRERSS